MADKKIGVLKFLFILVICYAGMQVFLLFPAAQYQDKLERVSTLKLTNNPDYTATLTADGNFVSGSGYLKGETVIDVVLASDEGLISKQTHFTEDGTFSFTINQRYQKGGASLVIRLESGARLAYRMEYDNGWFFPDNGYTVRGENAIKNRTVAPPQAAVLYLTGKTDKETVKETLDALSALEKDITKGIPDDNIYEKAKAISVWVSKNIYYDRDASKTMVTNETVALCNVLETHRTVCAGYANIYSALLEAAGIQSVNLKGSTTTAGVTYEEFDTGVENHEWVAFWYPNENRWVYTDCTWDSGQYYEKGMYFDAPNKMKFFDITPLALSLDHRIDRAEQRFYFEALSFFEEAEPSQSSSDFKEETLPSATTTFSQTEQQAKQQDLNKSILICSIVVAFSILILWVLIFVRRNKSSKK